MCHCIFSDLGIAFLAEYYFVIFIATVNYLNLVLASGSPKPVQQSPMLPPSPRPM